MKLSRFALGSVVALSLAGGGLFASPAAAQDCVTIYGGDVVNETVIDLNANAGTAISDASAGHNNAATTGGGHDGVDTASAGNGGVATAAANGGAISTGDINSGGNAGNAISVGDTVCADVAPAEEKAPKKEEKKKADVGGEVVALPDTGVGVGAGELNALLALMASAGAAAASFGLRRRSA